jgi:asparagine synthase (glutamine-hydrolysing)
MTSPEPMWGEPGGGMLHAARDRAYADLLRDQSVDVVLTGMGGDDVLFGYSAAPYFLADLLRQGRLGALMSELGRWSRSAYPRRSNLFWLEKGALHPLLPQRTAVSASHAAPWVTPKAIQIARACTRRDRALGPQIRSIAAKCYLGGVLNGAQIVSRWLLPRGMPADMRHPLLHRPLVAFLCAVPWDVQTGGNTNRRLQRQALDGVLPPEILHRQGKPLFDQALFRGLAETTAWFRASGRDCLLAEKGLWSGPVWDEAVSKARLGYVPVLKNFLAAASLEHWLAARGSE